MDFTPWQPVHLCFLTLDLRAATSLFKQKMEGLKGKSWSSLEITSAFPKLPPALGSPRESFVEIGANHKRERLTLSFSRTSWYQTCEMGPQCLEHGLGRSERFKEADPQWIFCSEDGFRYGDPAERSFKKMPLSQRASMGI